MFRSARRGRHNTGVRRSSGDSRTAVRRWSGRRALAGTVTRLRLRRRRRRWWWRRRASERASCRGGREKTCARATTVQLAIERLRMESDAIITLRAGRGHRNRCRRWRPRRRRRGSPTGNVAQRRRDNTLRGSSPSSPSSSSALKLRCFPFFFFPLCFPFFLRARLPSLFSPKSTRERKPRRRTPFHHPLPRSSYFGCWLFGEVFSPRATERDRKIRDTIIRI